MQKDIFAYVLVRFSRLSYNFAFELPHDGRLMTDDRRLVGEAVLEGPYVLTLALLVRRCILTVDEDGDCMSECLRYGPSSGKDPSFPSSSSTVCSPTHWRIASSSLEALNKVDR